MTDYFAKYAAAVAANGYRLVPIRPGHKAPLGLDWSQRGGDLDAVRSWLVNGYEHDYWIDARAKIRGTRTWRIDAFGVGLLASRNPGVDIDCHDESVSRHMQTFTEKLLGNTISRIGLAPKRLLVYRCEKPFGKITSKVFLDGQGRKAVLEILATGQQFVALAIHPDTKAPYRWTDKRGVHNTPLADLPLITAEDAETLRLEFERKADELGWDVVTDESRSLAVRNGDPFADVTPIVSGITFDELTRLTMLLPDAENYPTWIEIGMALFHQTGGSNEGLELWDSWSELAPNYDRTALETHWASFDIDGKGRAPITAKVILERAWTIEREAVEHKVSDAIEEMMACKEPNELNKVCREYKKVPFSSVDRTRLVGTLQTAYHNITKIKMPVNQARQMLAYEDTDRAEKHAWCADWVYVQADDKFANIRTGQIVSPGVFNNTFASTLMTPMDIAEGRTRPEALPQDVCLNVAKRPKVADRMYMPGFGPLFSINDEDYVNRYTERGMPKTPSEWTPEGLFAIECIEKHLQHLFDGERDRRLFMDVLAYIVQTGDRVGWAVFIQGTEGDGKSFWARMMESVLGMGNVGLIRGTDLKEKYTGWAEGSLFTMIEEVRLTGEHRWDAVNNLKPYLTNARVSVRRMQRDNYSIINRTTYCLTSNYKDGLPAAESNRYFTLFSRWQSAEKLTAWNLANPNYYSTLYGALNEAGSIRRWLLERKLSPEFNPSGRAPKSSASFEMQSTMVDDDTAAMREMLKTATEVDFSPYLLDSGLIDDRLELTLPRGRRLGQLLNQAGLSYVGETGFGGKTRRWWSDTPSDFTVIQADGIRRINAESIKIHLSSGL